MQNDGSPDSTVDDFTEIAEDEQHDRAEDGGGDTEEIGFGGVEAEVTEGEG